MKGANGEGVMVDETRPGGALSGVGGVELRGPSRSMWLGFCLSRWRCAAGEDCALPLAGVEAGSSVFDVLLAG